MVWLKRLAVVLAALIAIIGGGGFLLPSSAHVERSTVINVPEAQVFAMVNSFERFNEWSPWAKLDPNTRYAFTGPVSGVGAGMSWMSDNAAVGNGSQEIIESTAPTLVRVALKFDGQDSAISFHRLEPMETGTKVTWGFDAEFGNDVIGRWFGLLMFDSMIGGDYEKGLSSLKTVLEQQSVNPPAEPATRAPEAPQPELPTESTEPAGTAQTTGD